MSAVFPRVFGRQLPVVAHAEGALIVDENGKTYIDGAGGAVVVGIGHGDAYVAEVLAQQAATVSYVHGTQFSSQQLERYAGDVASLLPLADAHIYPVSGGSEANETAFKMARAFHLARGDNDRHKVIAREGSYHGNSLNALDASGKVALRAPYEPWLGRAVHVSAPNPYRCSADDHERCGRELAAELAATIEAEGPETVACFIGEPIVGATLGAMVPPDDYWPAIREVCDRYGVLLIADEVMTGFGRTGTWFGSEHFGLRPDIVTCGKGASSGYWPFGFAACSGVIYEALEEAGFTHGFTFSHSVMGASVGNAVLHRLYEDSMVPASKGKGELLRTQLAQAIGDHPNVGDIRGEGLLVGIELVADRSTKEPFQRDRRITERVIAAAFDLGLTIYPSTGCATGTEGDGLLLGPPFVITEAQLQRVTELVSGALDKVLPR